MKKILFCLVAFFMVSAQALVAPEMYMVDSTCPKDSPFKRAVWHNYQGREGGYYTPLGECISCDSTKAFMLINPDDCDICPNRTTQGIDDILSKRQCRLKQCPKEKPFYEEKWNWSGCKSCEDNPTHITKKECNQCPNMRWVDGLELCAPDKKGILYYSGESLGRGHLIGGMLPYTYSCGEDRGEKALRTGKLECARCPQTEFKDNWCYLHKQGK